MKAKFVRKDPKKKVIGKGRLKRKTAPRKTRGSRYA